MSLQIASPPDSTYQLPQRWLLSWCYPSLISRIHIGLLLRLAGVAVIVHVGGGVVHGGGVVARGVLGQVLAPHVGQHLRAREFSFAIWHVHVRSRFVRMIVQIVCEWYKWTAAAAAAASFSLWLCFFDQIWDPWCQSVLRHFFTKHDQGYLAHALRSKRGKSWGKEIPLFLFSHDLVHSQVEAAAAAAA